MPLVHVLAQTRRFPKPLDNRRLGCTVLCLSPPVFSRQKRHRRFRCMTGGERDLPLAHGASGENAKKRTVMNSVFLFFVGRGAEERLHIQAGAFDAPVLLVYKTGTMKNLYIVPFVLYSIGAVARSILSAPGPSRASSVVRTLSVWFNLFKMFNYSSCTHTSKYIAGGALRLPPPLVGQQSDGEREEAKQLQSPKILLLV